MKKIILASSIFLLAAGCDLGIGNPQFTIQSPAVKTLVLEEYVTGGNCPDGICFHHTSLYSDGTYQILSDQPAKSGQVDLSLVNNLEQQIQSSDFNAIASNPFRGTCPTAYDGTDTDYFFYDWTIANKNSEIDSCKVEIDNFSPLFQAVSAVQPKLQ